jgi:ankyrin repeat protein
MADIWGAANAGDLGEVQRLVGGDPGLRDAVARNVLGRTPLMLASEGAHIEVVRWLLDEGAEINKRDRIGLTPLYFACLRGDLNVMRFLVERGADPTIASHSGSTPLFQASFRGDLAVVRFLLGHPRAKAMIKHRNNSGATALWHACFGGRGEVVRTLLESGADPTIATGDGLTPMAIAKQDPPVPSISAEGRRECVAALEVSLSFTASAKLGG